jgi:hypothetical protein
MATAIHPSTLNYSSARRWRRYQFDLPVRIVLPAIQPSAEVFGRATALNEGGMTVFAPVELATGQQIEVEMSPPLSTESVRMRAVVRNRDEQAYGVELMPLNDSAKEVARFRASLSELASWVAR